MVKEPKLKFNILKSLINFNINKFYTYIIAPYINGLDVITLILFNLAAVKNATFYFSI
jgi:antibiotic biosynthesis monooxygenase (ABM) superfamily enzyme